MGSLRKGLFLCVTLGLAALFPATVLAADGVYPAAWPAWHLQAALLGLLAPVALVLLALGATPAAEASDTVAGALLAVVVGVVAYCVCGFAFQFGGIALRVNWPGLRGLAAEWSPIDPNLGLGWGAIGLRGFLLSGPAATADGYALAAVQLPAVAVAVLVPTLALTRWVGRPLLMIVAALVGGLIYPLVGNWVWGGGWLALLGRNVGLGHGFVDLGGSATVHLLGAAVALCGILLLRRRVTPPSRSRRQVVELPPVHFPLFMLLGSLLAPAGWVGMALANPLVPGDMPAGLTALGLVLAGLGGAAPGLSYSWLATGRADALLAARGMVAGLVAGSASCAFAPPWATLLVGLLAGSLLPLLQYAVEHRLRWHDPNAILSIHGMPGLLGALWLALAADGRWGIGWNWVGEWGVSGLLAGASGAADAPGQLLAQLAGVGSVLLLAALSSGLLFGAVRLIRRLAEPREEPQPAQGRRARRKTV